MATAFANIVLLHPGGPYNSTPFGICKENRCQIFQLDQGFAMYTVLTYVHGKVLPNLGSDLLKGHGVLSMCAGYDLFMPFFMQQAIYSMSPSFSPVSRTVLLEENLA